MEIHKKERQKREKVTLVRLFLSSPGDVEEERKKVHEVAAQLNRILGDRHKISIEVIDWKTNVTLDMGRPQEIINRQIGDYDIFVGIMWKRFGTPTGKAGSATEEELRIAYARWENNKKRPRILFSNTSNQKPCIWIFEVLSQGKVKHFNFV